MGTKSSHASGGQFEDEVRAIARALWGLPPDSGGSEIIDGHEFDCVCRTEDITHLIEVTTDPKLDKTTHDVNKLVAAKGSFERASRPVRLWIITASEPSPEQNTLAKRNLITIESVERFQGRLLESGSYLEARWNYRFGSSEDTASGNYKLPENEYVELPIASLDGTQRHNIDSLSNHLLNGDSVALLAPFGSGKSLTVREVFKNLRKKHFSNRTSPVPVAINLREHWGQSDTDEILRRHAGRIGFDKPHQLVRAWNGGRLIVLLDGFDEVVTQGVQSKEKRTAARRESLRMIREFIREARGKYGVLVAGRDNYFSTSDDLDETLALPRGAVKVSLGEFDEDKAREYLERKKIKAPLPDWLPRKPLLLSYLASRNLLVKALEIDGTRGEAYAWQQFVDLICLRDAELPDVEPRVVKGILERLALKSLTSMSGLGPFYEEDLSAAYRHVTGQDPLEGARLFLQRLPGLTARDQEEGATSFIDASLLDALRGEGLSSYIEAPFVQPFVQSKWGYPISHLGCAVAAVSIEAKGLPKNLVITAAKEAITRWNQPSLAAACLIAGSVSCEGPVLDCDGIVVKDAVIDVLQHEEVGFKNLKLEECLFNEVVIGEADSDNFTVSGAMIGRLHGVSQAAGTPTWLQADSVEHYDNLSTNAAIMNVSGPVGIKVLLTSIRKLFVQRGAGRKESAFTRGIDPQAKRVVGPVLELLEKHGLAFPHRARGSAIWHRIRGARARAMKILAEGLSSKDPIAMEAKAL